MARRRTRIRYQSLLPALARAIVDADRARGVRTDVRKLARLLGGAR